MKSPTRHITLVDPSERHVLRLGASTLFYRRLSLGALASIERQQALTLPAQAGQPAQSLLPPAAVEAAILAQVLLGWQGVEDPRTGSPAPYRPELAGRLPAAARRLLVRRAQKIFPPQEALDA